MQPFLWKAPFTLVRLQSSTTFGVQLWPCATWIRLWPVIIDNCCTQVALHNIQVRLSCNFWGLTLSPGSHCRGFSWTHTISTRQCSPTSGAIWQTSLRVHVQMSIQIAPPEVAKSSTGTTFRHRYSALPFWTMPLTAIAANLACDLTCQIGPIWT